MQEALFRLLNPALTLYQLFYTLLYAAVINHFHMGNMGTVLGSLMGSACSWILWVSFTGHQSIFRASSQPHGHLGRQAADHEGELGQQGEAVPVQVTVGSMVVWVWGMDGYGALAVFLPASVPFNAGSEQQDFQASYKILGHSGSLVSGEPSESSSYKHKCEYCHKLFHDRPKLEGHKRMHSAHR